MNNKKERVRTAKAMHEIVCSLNNECWYYNYWISVMPDEPTKEDFEDFGEDEQMFEELCSMFEYIMTDACRNEKPFYIGGRKRLSVKKLTPKTCKGFVNGNCSMNCPKAKLESACDRWDLDPSDFGMEYIDCKECYMNEENCTCEEDCYVYGNKDYCPKARNNRKEL